MWDAWDKLNIASGGKDDGRDNDGAEPGTRPTKIQKKNLDK